MATIRKRGNSYQIRVSCGYDTSGNQVVQTMTWKPADGMNKKQIEKELNRQAVMFEESVNHGFKTSAMKFQELAEVSGACRGVVRELCEERPQKHYIRENAPAHSSCLSCDRASAYRQDNRKAFAGLCELSRKRGGKRKDRQAPRTENNTSQSEFHQRCFQLCRPYGLGIGQSVQESDYPERRGQGEAYLFSGGDRTASDGYQRRGHKVPCFLLSDSVQRFPQERDARS